MFLQWMLLFARFLYGLYFLVSGISKWVYLEPFQNAVLAYQLLPRALAIFFASYIPWLEVLLGLCILVGLCTRKAIAASFCLLGLFTAAVFWMLLQGRPIDCGCFLGGPHSEPITGWKVLSNLLLMAFTAWLFSMDHGWMTLDRWLRGSEGHSTPFP
jgi:uncharacterized membrane protein YphA (DoxX/SURF4 family)